LVADGANVGREPVHALARLRRALVDLAAERAARLTGGLLGLFLGLFLRLLGRRGRRRPVRG